MGEVIALLQAGTAVVPDARGQHRALQVTWHERGDVFVVSLWRAGRCTGTVHLSPADAAALISALAEGLARRS